MEFEIGRVVLVTLIFLGVAVIYAGLIIGSALLYTLPSRKGPNKSE